MSNKNVTLEMAYALAKQKYNFDQCIDVSESNFMNLIDDYEFLSKLLDMYGAHKLKSDSEKDNQYGFVEDIFNDYLSRNPNIALLREKRQSIIGKTQYYSLGDKCLDSRAYDIIKCIFEYGGAVAEDTFGNNLPMRCVKNGNPELVRSIMTDKQVRRHTNNNGENISMVAINTLSDKFIEDHKNYTALVRMGIRDNVMSLQQDNFYGYNIGMKCANALDGKIRYYRVRAAIKELLKEGLENPEARRQKNKGGIDMVAMAINRRVKFRLDNNEMEL
ncbi:MAG: hypothetical protein IJW59_00400 [Clostridia bacterium]|nr:hypothetical protein [Clostridia bacterium]